MFPDDNSLNHEYFLFLLKDFIFMFHLFACLVAFRGQKDESKLFHHSHLDSFWNLILGSTGLCKSIELQAKVSAMVKAAQGLSYSS